MEIVLRACQLCSILICYFALIEKSNALRIRKTRGRGRSRAEDVAHIQPFSGQFIRLGGNSTLPHEGRVEVYRAGRWGVVCDDRWEMVDANIACQQLGFLKGAEEALEEAAFGFAPWTNKSDILMDEIQCRGSERMLQECSYVDRNHDCNLLEAASVRCYPNDGCEEGWIAGPTGCYKFLNSPVKNVKHASNLCIRQKGYLTVIESSEEADFLSNTLRLLHPDKPRWATSGRVRKGNWLWEKIYRSPPPPRPTRPPGQSRGRGRGRGKGRSRSARAVTDYENLMKSQDLHAEKRYRRAAGKKRKPKNKKETIPMSFTKWFPGWLPENTYSEPSRNKGDFCLTLSSVYEYSRRRFDSVDYLYWDNTKCKFKGEPVYSICEKDRDLPNIQGRSQECYHGKGEDYRGNIQHTRLGTLCQSWELGPDMDTSGTKGLGDHNYCRNPDNSASPWCWVDVSAGLFGYCPVPECQEEQQAEIDDTVQCPDDEFFCSQNAPDERCIPASFQCDGESDCEGNHDEEDCDYKLPLFEKEENSVPNADHDVRYIHSSLELCAKFCVETKDIVCRSFAYKKDHRECFLFSKNKETAVDSSDFLLYSELYDYYDLTSQTEDCYGMHRCRNTKCIASDLVCNGQDDCHDMSDEVECDEQEVNQTPFEMRLRGGSIDSEGRVEIRYRGEWGVICDDAWGLEDAKVVCNMLGYRNALRAPGHSMYGPGNANFLLSNVNCIGNETSLLQCRKPDWKVHNCHAYEVAGVECQNSKQTICDPGREFSCPEKCIQVTKVCNQEQDCSDGADEMDCQATFSLVNGDRPSEGRLQMTLNGVEGTICDDGFGNTEATVACRSLGYSHGLVSNSTYGQGSGVIWMDDLDCGGREEDLRDCLSKDLAVHNCDHSEDVGIVCFNQPVPMTTTPPTPNGILVKLVDGNSTYGRVHVNFDGEWGTVCDDSWDDKDATVVCRMLNFEAGRTLTEFPGARGIDILMDEVQCLGTERDLSECQFSRTHDCSHSEDVAVACYSDGSAVCKEEEFRCPEKCVHGSKICNGVNDCVDGADEYDCRFITMNLVNGTSRYNGRLQITIMGLDGTVCDDNIGQKEVNVICKTFGYNYGGRMASQGQFGYGRGMIWIDNLNCTGQEDSFLNCQRNPYGVEDCTHSEDVGIICYPQPGVTDLPTLPTTTPAPDCGEQEFRCREKCIHGSKLCNNVTDCVNGDDENECRFITMELVNGTDRYSGRLQMTMNGVAGTVCDDNFGLREVTVACRHFGYNHGGRLASQGQFGYGRGMIWLDDLNCTGQEDSLLNCGRKPFGVEDCGHTEDVGIICFSQPGEIPDCLRDQFQCLEKCLDPRQVCNGERECFGGEDEADCDFNWDLVAGSNRGSGRLQVTINGVVGTVCDDGFEAEEITVACRMFGFNHGGVLTKEFGPGTGVTWLDDFNCTGRERTLEECRHSPIGVENCVHTEDVGLICNTVAPTQTVTTIRTTTSPEREVIELVGGSGPNEGRLEVIIDGVRGTVCDDQWSQVNSDLVCQLLGYSRGGVEVDPSVFGYGDARTPIHLDDVDCFGFESSLLECPRAESHNCEHSEDVGIRCILPPPPVDDNDDEVVDEDAYLFPGCGSRPLEDALNARKRREADGEFKQIAAPPRKEKIVGGNAASYGMFPWQVGVRKVYLVSRSGKKYTSGFCGGTIISEDWIVSAAHCYYGLSKESFTVRVGDHNNKEITSYEEDIEQEFDLQELIIHSRYDDNTYDYDIALIKVKRKLGEGIQFNDHIQPACLPRASTAYLEGLTCHISGWGTVESDGASPSIMKQAEVPLLSEETCRDIYGRRQTNRMFCAGILAGGVDTCQGDSGGPLVCRDRRRNYLLYGVTSWGVGCGRPNLPGMYAHVKVLMPWIRDQIKRYP